MTVLNQVRPSSLSYQKSFSARALPGIRAADIVADELAAKGVLRCVPSTSHFGEAEGGGRAPYEDEKRLRAWYEHKR